MLKKLKEKLKKADNHGSSFVLVVVSTTFLCVMISALLMGTMLAYKLKSYRLNSLNNFYSVEQAMDEIYAGIGATTNEYLYSAYTTTAELVVYYDAVNGEYTNLDDDEANELFKKLFMQGIMDDANYSSMPALISTLQSYITVDKVSLVCDDLKIIYTDSNGNERYISYNNGSSITSGSGSFDSANIEQITFKNICVKREIEMNDNVASGTYIQSITTDLILNKPEYNVSFDMTSSNSDSLYSYALLADMGLEVNGESSTTDVKIVGNVYAASDYYNKDYNNSASTKVTNIYSNSLETKWGSTDESAYSGIFVTGEQASLTLSSDVIVCSGSVAAFNGAQIDLSSTTSSPAELWADNIIIGGTEGGSIVLSANAYIYDDTELNAENSTLKFSQGRYFGYSYSAEDSRSIDLLSGALDGTVSKLATGYSLKSHFSDSAIIVNGEGSSLDLSSLSSVYIAGKSYIEFSKLAAASITDEEERTAYGLTDDSDYAYTSLLDYSTGQSLDVKSNQLIFLTNWTVSTIYVSDEHKEDKDENGDYLYLKSDGKTFKDGYEALPDEYADYPSDYTYAKLKFPTTYSNNENIATLYEKYLESDGVSVIAIQQEVSGHDYYYLYVEGDEAEEFVEEYYALVEKQEESVLDSLYNVVNYEDFDVQIVLPESNGSIDNSKFKTGGAITAQNSDDTLYVAASADTTLNVDLALESATTSKTFVSLLGETDYSSLKSASSELVDSADWTTEEKISNVLNYMYINLKDHLSVANTSDDTTNAELSAYELTGYSKSGSTYSSTDSNGDKVYNYSLTPLTSFVDYEYLFDNAVEFNTTEPETGALIYVTSGNVKLTGSSSYRGIIICGGNVEFGDDVTSFEGLIIAGGKVICNSSITLKSNANYVANVLQKCDTNVSEGLSVITSHLIKNFVSSADSNSSSVASVSISDISYNDILVFQNWKKNVE